MVLSPCSISNFNHHGFAAKDWRIMNIKTKPPVGDIEITNTLRSIQNEGEKSMNLKAKSIFLLVGLMFYSCGYSPPNPNLQYAINNSVPICIEGLDCSKKWEAAQIWVAKNAGNKISIVTPVLIETAESDSTRLSVRVTKEMQDSATYKILFTGWCHNLFGCFPDHNKSQYDFNLFVGAYGKPVVKPEAKEQSLNSKGYYE